MADVGVDSTVVVELCYSVFGFFSGDRKCDSFPKLSFTQRLPETGYSTTAHSLMLAVLVVRSRRCRYGETEGRVLAVLFILLNCREDRRGRA